MTLTCLSCKLLFSAPELHQEHYKSDWHRYNLERRLAELPPLTKEEFEKRAAVFKEDSELKVKESLRCDSCNKVFSSKNALLNHFKSNKHLEALSRNSSKAQKGNSKTRKVEEAPSKTVAIETEDAKVDGSSDEEGWEDDDSNWESCEETEDGEMKKIVIDTNDCLFCDHSCDSTEANVSHMMEVHSFFIPDIEYLTDVDGLIGYLAAKIHLGHLCLWCSGKGKGFHSVKSVRQHMLDKGHFKMFHEGEALLEYADFYDYSSVDYSDQPLDVEAIDDLLAESDYELVLPSGATVGHRSLAIYYKQNLKPISSNSQQKVQKVLQYYKALGYKETTKKAAVMKARDFHYMKNIKDRYYLKLGVKKNSMRHHLRHQVMF